MRVGISNIILDLGGVILEIDPQLSIEAFQQLGNTDQHVAIQMSLQMPFFEDFEKGNISENTFYDHIRNLLGAHLSDENIKTAWNAMLLHFPLRRLQILQQLQLHYNTFLLSNTNSIHETAFNKMLHAQVGFKSLGVFFDKIYYSHHLHMRKPEAAIFEKVLNENELDPAKTLFIDDSLEHIEAANRLGIQTIHLKKDMSIEDIFKSKSEI